ncbi:MAG: AAA family ATPase [Thermodesulfobacteriota bacterium]
MNESVVNVNGGVARLANVGLCLSALDKARDRPAHLPGLVTFSGPSGWGKSTAAAGVATLRRAYYVEAKSYWSKKAFIEALLKEMGITPRGRTISAMAEEVSEQLAKSKRPLIIDEFDHIVDKNAVELVRDLYEGSGAAILLIGEEQLPAKLERWERFHGRVLDWVQAQPASMEDAAALRDLYCTVAVADDLLAHLVDLAKGSVRRICVNLERIQDTARNEGLDRVDMDAWGGRPLFTGQAPRRRAA